MKRAVYLSVLIGFVVGAILGTNPIGRAHAQAAAQTISLSLSSLTTSGNQTVGGNLSVTGTSALTGDVTLGGALNVSSGGIGRSGSGSTAVQGNSPAGGSGVNVIIDTGGNNYTTGDKVLSIRNFGSEKASFDNAGNVKLNHLSCAMSSGTTCTATVPTGSVCVCGAQAGTASAVACAVSSTTATCTASASNSSTWNVLVW